MSQEYGDQLYKRSMGRAYDRDLLLREVANGNRGAHPGELDYGTEYEDDGQNDLSLSIEQVSRERAYRDEVLQLTEKRLSGELTAADVSEYFIEGAEQMLVDLKSQLDALSQKDRLFAKAVQDWTVDELTRRENSGENYDNEIEERMAVLDKLLAELVAEDEDPALIKFAATWREETIVDATIEEMKRLYDLAA